MPETLVCLAVGLLVCFFGIRHMMGDISSLHSYHRSRVSPEDVRPFGRLVGVGTLICGISVILMAVGTLIAELTSNEVFVTVGSAIVIVGVIVGCAISFYAMKKYNGGIF